MEQDARRRLEDLLDREIEVARVLAATLAAEQSRPDRRLARSRRAKGRGEDPLSTPSKSSKKSAARCAPAANAARALAAAVAERWRTLMELMAGCRTANEVNGHIIHVRQHQVRQLIDIVRGGPAITYSPQGKTFAKALRALARA